MTGKNQNELQKNIFIYKNEVSKLFTRTYLARQDISEEREGVVDGLVVDDLVQVLDEDVSGTRSTHGGVALAPHDSHWLSAQRVEVHCVQGTFSLKNHIKHIVHQKQELHHKKLSYNVFQTP